MTDDGLTLHLNNGKVLQIGVADLVLHLHDDRELTMQIDAQRLVRFGQAAWSKIAQHIQGAAPSFWLPVGTVNVPIILN